MTTGPAAAPMPWSPIVGLARSVLAVGTLLTLTFSPTRVLFAPLPGAEAPPLCEGLTGMSVYCLASVGGVSGLEAGRWVSMLVLAVVASGWRPQLTCLPHWWVAWSLQTSGHLVDGGDQVTAVLTLLLLPLLLTDRRRWHWRTVANEADRPDLTQLAFHNQLVFYLAWGSVLVVKVQVAVIYLHAAVGKFGVTEWADGTALYYWMSDPTFGPTGLLGRIVLSVTQTAVGVTLLTWGTMLLELTLVLGLLASRPWRLRLLAAGLIFHTGIAVTMGLWSFLAAMAGALLLFLVHPGEEDVMTEEIESMVPEWLHRGRPQLGTAEPLAASESLLDQRVVT